MALTFKQLSENLISRRTFDQVSYYGTLCGEPVRKMGTLDSYKGGEYMPLPIKVETQFYYYLSRVWKFVIVTESAHGYQVGEIIKASWQNVQKD